MREAKAMRILAVISGDYGQRHVTNVRTYGPSEWTIETWRAPAVLPPVLDCPEDFLPGALPAADLILAFGEHPGVAELLPDIARMIGARAVIAPVDNESWLPRRLARQLRGRLQDLGVTCFTPKPLCSLTETDYGLARRKRIQYENPWISEFVHFFGQPDLHLTIDPKTQTIFSVVVVRDAVCGCARHVAEGLVGVSADDADPCQVGYERVERLMPASCYTVRWPWGPGSSTYAVL
jgi:hypothetical protein